jgi:DNA-binding transcriptional MerR regulator
VSDANLLSIGAFGLVTGLSINALRHYDEVGLLRPASVDPVTGYRRYQPGQVRQAKMICALRHVDLPIDAVREVLSDLADGALRPVLLRHRAQNRSRSIRPRSKQPSMRRSPPSSSAPGPATASSC